MTETKKTDLTLLLYHLGKMQENTQAIIKQVAPIIEMKTQMQKKFQETVAPILEAQKSFAKQFQPAIEAWRELIVSATTAATNWARIVEPISEFQRRFENALGPVLKQFTEEIEKLPSRMKDALLLLGKHGWFIDFDMPTTGIWQLEKALRAGNAIKAEEALAAYYRKKSPEILKKLKKRFPRRAMVMDAAFTAHARGEYLLSVPVLLAQADGICQELIVCQLYAKRGRPIAAKFVKTIAADTLRAALLYPVTQPLPLTAPPNKRKAGELNRHQVLHGESVDYGNEVNSLKAISLLNYIMDVFKKNPVNYK